MLFGEVVVDVAGETGACKNDIGNKEGGMLIKMSAFIIVCLYK